MNLGETIYRLRTKQNMSQGDLADVLDVSRQSVSKWENNSATPDLDKLIKMSDLFQVSLDELVGRPPCPGPAPASKTPPTPNSLTTADMISILLLLFGILIPVVVLATAESHNSSFLMVLGLFLIPPAATICAAINTPHNTLLFRAFMVYDIVFGVLALLAANVLSPIIAVIYFFAAGIWIDKRA